MAAPTIPSLSVERRFSTTADGDFAVDVAPAPEDPLDGDGPALLPEDALAARRSRFHPGEWTWLRQVHGADVVVVDRPGAHAGRSADASVTAAPGAVLAIQTADCTPILLADPAAGVIGACHAGWRGLAAGVVAATVRAMHDLGAGSIAAHIGPHIRARCYEFAGPALDEARARLGDGAVTTTAWGTPALDLTAASRALLAAVGVHDVVDVGGCTACEPDRLWSHRARGDRSRLVSTIGLRMRDDPGWAGRSTVGHR